MANIPVVLCFGNSNCDGFGLLSAVSVSDWSRWTGELAYPTVYPWDVEVPTVRVWTPKMPSGAVSTDEASAKAASQITLPDLTYDAATHLDKWIYVRIATAGQGQYRRIAGTSSGSAFDVTAAWTTEPNVGATCDILLDSDTVDTATASSIVRLNTGGATGYTSAVVGKWCVMLTGANAGYARRISGGATNTLTFEFPFAVAPSAGDAFRVCTNTATVDGSSTNLVANGSLRSLRFYFDNAESFNTGYEYPNYKSYFKPGPAGFKDIQQINFVPELGWQIAQDFAEPPVFVHCGIPSATMSVQYLGTVIKDDYPALNTTFSWNDDIRSLDFSPSSPNGIYDQMLASLTAACAAIVAEGNVPNVVGVFTVVADVDALTTVRADKAEQNMRNLISMVRQYIDDNSLSLSSGSKIPWLIANVAGPNWPALSTVNAAMQAVADDYDYVGLVDTTDYTLNGDDVHIAGNSEVQLGKDFYAAWKEAKNSEGDASRETSDLLTLSEIRTKVKRRYERTVTSNNSSDAQIDMFINDSLREFVNTIGDNAWFLRKSELLTVTPTYPSTLTMPRKCKRVLALESTSCPGHYVVWKGLSYTEQGRLKIALHDYSSTTYQVHYIVLPDELEKDSDVCLVPRDYIELIVVLACKRLAEAGGNQAIAGYYAVEVDRLYKYVRRNMQTFDRMRQGQLNPTNPYSDVFNGPGLLNYPF